MKWLIQPSAKLDAAVREKLKADKKTLAEVVRQQMAAWAGIEAKDAEISVGRPKPKQNAESVAD